MKNLKYEIRDYILEQVEEIIWWQVKRNIRDNIWDQVWGQVKWQVWSQARWLIINKLKDNFK